MHNLSIIITFWSFPFSSLANYEYVYYVIYDHTFNNKQDRVHYIAHGYFEKNRHKIKVRWFENLHSLEHGPYYFMVKNNPNNIIKHDFPPRLWLTNLNQKLNKNVNPIHFWKFDFEIPPFSLIFVLIQPPGYAELLEVTRFSILPSNPLHAHSKIIYSNIYIYIVLTMRANGEISKQRRNLRRLNSLWNISAAHKAIPLLRLHCQWGLKDIHKGDSCHTGSKYFSIVVDLLEKSWVIKNHEETLSLIL